MYLIKLRFVGKCSLLNIEFNDWCELKSFFHVMGAVFIWLVRWDQIMSFWRPSFSFEILKASFLLSFDNF